MPRKTRLEELRLAGPGRASMRPRPDAAENARARALFPRSGSSFNEAAARCRGKHAPGRVAEQDEPASMRPRPDAAENKAIEMQKLQTLKMLQ